LGKTRWFVERTISWFHNFGRLRIRRDRVPTSTEPSCPSPCR
jgi:hypothetical protein